MKYQETRLLPGGRRGDKRPIGAASPDAEAVAREGGAAFWRFSPSPRDGAEPATPLLPFPHPPKSPKPLTGQSSPGWSDEAWWGSGYRGGATGFCALGGS